MATEKTPPKLHEFLAVMGDLTKAAQEIQAETIETFTKKPDRFLGHHRQLQMFDADRQQENLVEPEKTITTTVAAKLAYNKQAVVRWLDNVATLARSNQEARADVVVNGETVLQGVPSTALLNLETHLQGLRNVYMTIPTLAPGVDWEPDPEKGANIYKSPVETVLKTEKKPDWTIIVPATDKHPAQVKEWMTEKAVGKFSRIQWSGMISPAEKSVLLERIDLLIREVKKAQQRANRTEAVVLKIGESIFGFIHGG